MSALGLLKAPFPNEWTQKWAISNILDVYLTQLARFKKLHMNVLVRWNAFSCFMTSSAIWSAFQNAVKGNLKKEI